MTPRRCSTAYTRASTDAAEPAGTSPRTLTMSDSGLEIALWSLGWLSACGVSLALVDGGTVGGYAMGDHLLVSGRGSLDGTLSARSSVTTERRRGSVNPER